MRGLQEQLAQRTISSTSPLVRFFSFDDGGVLFLNGSRRLWALNASSACVWCCLEDCRSIDALADRLAKRFSIDTLTARRDILATLNRFEREGLLGQSRPVDPPESDGFAPIHFSGKVLAGSRNWAVRQSFRIPGHIVDFCCQDLSLGEVFVETMGHLAVNCDLNSSTRIAVVPNLTGDDNWDIYLNGKGCFHDISRIEVLPHLFVLVFITTCEALRDRLLFHAGVVEKGGRAILLPAEAGSGKSTLVAALVTRGWRYFSDELAALDTNDLRVLALPLPASIKQGAVAVLSEYYSGLPARPSFQRPDGKLVRYLPPPANSVPTVNSTASIRALIFPEYRTDVSTCLRTIDKRDALQRLARTGSSNREFTERDVAAMIAVTEQSPCYEIITSDLEAAVSLLEAEKL